MSLRALLEAVAAAAGYAAILALYVLALDTLPDGLRLPAAIGLALVGYVLFPLAYGRLSRSGTPFQVAERALWGLLVGLAGFSLLYVVPNPLNHCETSGIFACTSTVTEAGVGLVLTLWFGIVSVVAFAVHGRRRRVEDSTHRRSPFDRSLQRFFERSGALPAAFAAAGALVAAYVASTAILGRVDEPFVTGGFLSAGILAGVNGVRTQLGIDEDEHGDMASRVRLAVGVGSLASLQPLLLIQGLRLESGYSWLTLALGEAHLGLEFIAWPYTPIAVGLSMLIAGWLDPRRFN